MSVVDKLNNVLGWLTPSPKNAQDKSPYKELTPVDAEAISINISSILNGDCFAKYNCQLIGFLIGRARFKRKYI